MRILTKTNGRIYYIFSYPHKLGELSLLKVFKDARSAQISLGCHQDKQTEGRS